MRPTSSRHNPSEMTSSLRRLADTLYLTCLAPLRHARRADAPLVLLRPPAGLSDAELLRFARRVLRQSYRRVALPEVDLVRLPPDLRRRFRSRIAQGATDEALLLPPAPPGRHAVWRRVRVYDCALAAPQAHHLAGAWPEPNDTPSAGPLLRAAFFPTPPESAAEAVRDARVRGGWFAGIAPPAQRPDVLFLPHNAYHTREMLRVAEELERRGRTALFIDITDAYHDEGARGVLHEDRRAHEAWTDDTVNRLRPGAVFVMNDWSGPPAKAVRDARDLAIPSFALVEGVQDFEDTHVEHIGVGVKRSPYHHADTALLVGDFDRRFFEGCDAEVTGSTRIEALAREPRSGPRAPRAVINSNFTYGLYTRQQPKWLAGAVRACREVGIEFVVSRHHADAGDMTGLPLSDRPLYDELREAAVVISRFSGVILEAMALDTPVIYYNPHDERMATFRDAGDAFPTAETPEGLAAVLGVVLGADPVALAERQRAFFATRVSIDPDRPSWVRIADAVERRLARG